ncbi:hypothetical protein GQ55_5G214400 [Panicum hallii var. hallii]|uniref:Uncharacterized protein n=1 Tax=Panicum hallii var. hallii TaxID=1504633 RepID=A0A2T7DIR3_9POAL|nr:hypothetical protein GQ55_5G214400 [Panicum hallii var. hallii]
MRRHEITERRRGRGREMPRRREGVVGTREASVETLAGTGARERMHASTEPKEAQRARKTVAANCERGTGVAACCSTQPPRHGPRPPDAVSESAGTSWLPCCKRTPPCRRSP